MSTALPSVRISSYRELIVWQKSMDLVIKCYAIAKTFPSDERFGLTSQLQRAATSVPCNIAEGHGRRHIGDKLHHLSIANGSLKEVETLILLAHRLAYLGEPAVEAVLKLAEEIGKMLTALRQKLSSRST